jgi:hypothetical protein
MNNDQIFEVRQKIELKKSVLESLRHQKTGIILQIMGVEDEIDKLEKLLDDTHSDPIALLHGPALEAYKEILCATLTRREEEVLSKAIKESRRLQGID